MLSKNIVVLGSGESGCGAALLANKQGYNVFVSDNGKINNKYKEMLNKSNIKWEENGHNINNFINADEIIKSPGISIKSFIIKKLFELNKKITSEIDFGLRFTNSKIIAVTGSNGKTTTTLLIEHILKKSKKNVRSVGNINRGLCMQICKNNYEYYILELSSFQLRDSFNIKPYIAIILNISEDHIDEHGSFDSYIASKIKITKNQDLSNHFIFYSGDKTLNKLIYKDHIKSNLYTFSSDEEKKKFHSYLGNTKIKILTNKKQFVMNINELALQGKHNVYNSMAAAIASKIMNIEDSVIRDSLRDFKNIEHRLEKFIKIYGIDFINDSKATNVNSVWYALESMNKPVVWIAGGIDKGNNYEVLQELVKAKVKALICLGNNNKTLKKVFKKSVSVIHECDNMKKAVRLSLKLASSGDIVLLSPACASFDLYKNYEERGNDFKNEVKRI